jgi:hypothetical protein
MFKRANLFLDKCNSLFKAIILALVMTKSPTAPYKTTGMSLNLIKLFLKLFINHMAKKSTQNTRKLCTLKNIEIIITELY